MEWIPESGLCWGRWGNDVDDTCYIMKKSTIEGLLSHLNSVRPSIKLIMEVEKDGSIPFLDTLLQRRDDGNLNPNPKAVTLLKTPPVIKIHLCFAVRYATCCTAYLPRSKSLV